MAEQAQRQFTSGEIRCTTISYNLIIISWQLQLLYHYSIYHRNNMPPIATRGRTMSIIHYCSDRTVLAAGLLYDATVVRRRKQSVCAVKLTG